MNAKTITIGLLSHYFKDTNLGCSALSICNVVILDQVAKELGIEVEYKILVNEKQPHADLDFTKSKYEYRVFPSTKQVIKHPFKLLNTRVFDGCDLVFNLCAGDGFTDIYGKSRTFSESYMVIIGHKKGYEMVLSPQTIGPFKSKISKLIAKHMMNCCNYIFTRDRMSYDLCCKMGQRAKTIEVIDVALALPYKKTELEGENNIGINVSGLLYNDENNRFGLSIEYKELVHEMVSELIQIGNNVHLISHVLIPGGTGEDDYAACEKVHDLFPNTILAPKFNSPIEVKGYISGLNLFIGARMHATIAAISSGIPVIPIAYSRKVNGLYGNLKYPFFIDAKSESMTKEIALSFIFECISSMNEMKICIEESRKLYTESLNAYKTALKKILAERLY